MQGHTDIPLNATGLQQADAAAALIATAYPTIRRIVTSPLSRAHATALPVANRLGVPLVLDARIQERSFGVIEGKSREELETWRADALARGVPPEENGYPCTEGAETFAELKTRVFDALTDHLGDGRAQDDVLFVSHGGVYRMLLHCFGMQMHIPENAKPCRFDKCAVQSMWTLHFPT